MYTFLGGGTFHAATLPPRTLRDSSNVGVYLKR